MKKKRITCIVALWARFISAEVVVNMDLSSTLTANSAVTRSLSIDTASEKTYAWDDGGAVKIRSVLLWDSADFLATNSVFDSTSNSVVSASYVQSVATYQYARFIIRDGSTYYISSAAGPDGTAPSATLRGDTVGLQWAAFDVNDWGLFDGAGEDLGFGSLTWSTRTFDNVTGVGLITYHFRQNDNSPLIRLGSFSASLGAVVVEDQPVPKITISVLGSSMILDWDKELLPTYTVQSIKDLVNGSWSNLLTGIAGEDGMIHVTSQMGQS